MTDFIWTDLTPGKSRRIRRSCKDEKGALFSRSAIIQATGKRLKRSSTK